MKEYKFRSLHDFLLNSATNIHSFDREVLFEKTKDGYKGITYGFLLEKVDEIAAYLMHHGINKGDKVGIILENSPEYIYIDQALQKIGAVNVSIYPTLSNEETQYIINDSNCKILVVGNAFLLRKFKKIEDRCPDITNVIMDYESKTEGEKFISFGDMLIEGKKRLPEYKNAIDDAFSKVTQDDLSALIYTSGTTGVPKGVMLSHYNFMSNCYDAIELCPAIISSDSYLSFLPLSHVFERMATYYLSTFVGCQIAFSEGIEKVAQNMGEFKPTVFASVPRLLERIHEKVYQNATKKGGISAKIFLWAIKTGRKRRHKIEHGKKPGPFLAIKFAIAEKLVFSKIKGKLGGRLKIVVSGGGALPKHVGEFFGDINLKVQEGYGLTETSPFVTVNEFHRQVYGTVGRVAPRQQVALMDIETQEIIAIQDYNSFNPDFSSEEGEILCKGPNILQGYYNKPAETAEVFDKDGWFHTGDIGKFEKGYLKITDRLKNMLKTSLGKNIYPTPIENAYLQSSKIEQILLLGDKREFVTAIIVPSKEELQNSKGFREEFFTNPEPFIEDEEVEKWLWEDIKKYGEHLAKYEKLKSIIIKRNPFSMESGELTITQKIKRKIVLERYGNKIEDMYAK